MGTNSTGCTEWERDFDPTTEQPQANDAQEPTPFYGAQCPSYPACKGGCGLGCTHDIETGKGRRGNHNIRRAERKEEEARHLLREAAYLRDLQKRLDKANAGSGS